jgi:iron complex transport system permease protein
MALNVSLTTFVLSISLASYDLGRQVMYWLLGGLEGRMWDHLLLSGPAIVVGTIVITAHARDLDALLLGEVSAQSVGVDVPRVRMRLVLACALVVGAAVAVAGPIGFVGLIAPHICRSLIGTEHRFLAPATLLFGGLFLVACDTLSRLIIAPAELPVGVLTALLGGPFFIGLLLRRPIGGSSFS